MQVDGTLIRRMSTACLHAFYTYNYIHTPRTYKHIQSFGVFSEPDYRSGDAQGSIPCRLE